MGGSEELVTSTQFGLEHRDQGLYLTEVGHQVDVLGVRLAAYGLQDLHVHPAHSYSKDLDASLPGFSCDLLHRVLGSAICHDHSDTWNVQVDGSGPLLLREGHLHGILDGQTGHGPSGEVRHVLHSLLHFSSGGVGVEGELRLDHAAVLEQTDPGRIVANVQKLEQVGDEGLDLQVVTRVDAPGAVDDEDEVQRRGFTRILCDEEEDWDQFW